MTPTLYEGTKRLYATPMTRGEYNAYRGWENPAGENPEDGGYLVEYQDGGKANDSRHARYISWSPADVFERTYKPVVTTLPVIDPGPDSLEREIQAKANRAPRVTPADLEAEIVGESFFTAADGVCGASTGLPGADLLPEYVIPPLSLLTFCVLVLRNGFTVTGESACASPENFNAEIGRRIARENAVNKVWPLLGFRLRDELARPVLTEGDASADLAGTCRPDNHSSACTACKQV